MRIFSVCILSFALCGVVIAQEEEKAGPTWTGEASLSYVQSSGNQSTKTLGTGFTGARESERYRFSMAGEAISTSREGESTRRTTLAGMAERNLNQSLSIFGRSSFLSEPLGAIAQQVVTEGGLKWIAHASEYREVTIAGSAGRTFEVPVSGAERESFTSGSVRLTWRWTVGTALFGQEYSLLENLGELGDWRSEIFSSAAFAISSKLGVKVTHRFTHVRMPAPERLRSDQQFLVSLVAKFPGS